MNKENVFNKLNHINVNEHTEQKKNLTYLSWAWAWAETKNHYPEATYKIERFGEDNKPYLHDKDLGYMVFTSVTINELTHEMWLPVMDHSNNAMKDEPQTVIKWKKEVEVAAATMFDINSTIMRCLTKNLAMFGLGLYIYAGEDLPQTPPASTKQVNGLKKLIEEYAALAGEKNGERKLVAWASGRMGVDDLDLATSEQIKKVSQTLKDMIARKKEADKEAEIAKAEKEEAEQETLLEGNTTEPKTYVNDPENTQQQD